MANDCVSVKNVIGSSRNKTSPDGDSWQAFWERQSPKKWPSKCKCCEKNSATLGGHVTIVGQGKKQYIIPMCSACNNIPTGEFRNIDKSWLIPVVND